jgi:hypothetical protein
MEMIAMTTKSSIKVKPRRPGLLELFVEQTKGGQQVVPFTGASFETLISSGLDCLFALMITPRLSTFVTRFLDCLTLGGQLQRWLKPLTTPSDNL